MGLLQSLRFFRNCSFLLKMMVFGGLMAGCFSSSIAQEDSLRSLPPLWEDSIDYRPLALGSFSLKISSPNPEAQKWFDQGIQLKYAFAVEDAARSFIEARKADPECAICYWGEAWALGAYLNGEMSKKHAPYALEAIRKADSLSAIHASDVEKALIKAMKPRYIEDYDPENRREQDSLYALAMAEVYQKFPDDHDVATVYAEALFLLEPRRGTRDLNDLKVRRIHQILEKVLQEDKEHPGACHLYIHATESTDQPEKALDCANLISQTIPGASHINHMPSHTYNELGMWGEAVKANLQAWHSDQKAAIGEGFAIYPGHNLHMLLFAASMDGQGAIAIQAGKDHARLTGNTMYQVLTLIRFGRFEEVLEVPDRPTQAFAGGMWDFAQGYAKLRTGEADFAGVYLQRIRKVADTTEADFRGHLVGDLLQVAAGILEGEMLRASGEAEAAIVVLEKAVEIEDSLRWDEPEPMPFAARHWLGAVLMEAGKYRQAEAVYRADLEDHPNNGWSAFGLMKALEVQGKPTKDAKAHFEKCWTRSDIWLNASRF